MVCAITDPFCSHAKSAKWPDGNGASTLTAQVRGHQVITTFSNGGNVTFFSPSMRNGQLGSGAFSTNYTLNSTLSPTPGELGVQAYLSTYRVVTCGMIIRNIAPALTASGYIIVNRISELPAMGATIVPGNTYATVSTTHAITAGMEIPVIFRPVGASARVFATPSANNGIFGDAGFDVISVEIVGAPATTNVLDIEFVMNIEFTLPITQNALTQFMPTTAPISPNTITVANKIQQSLGDLVYTSVKQFASNTVNLATKALAARFMPAPVARMAQMAISVD